MEEEAVRLAVVGEEQGWAKGYTGRPFLILLNLSSFIEHAKAKQQQVREEFWEAEGRTERLLALCLGAHETTGGVRRMLIDPTVSEGLEYISFSKPSFCYIREIIKCWLHKRQMPWHKGGP